MRHIVVSRHGRHQPGQQGQSLVEAAVVFPLLLMAALGLVQFALFAHAEHVVTGAVQDGARFAAAEDRTLADGLSRTSSLLRAGLGRQADAISVGGSEGSEAVAIQAQGQLPLVIPWFRAASLPVRARSVVSKERFRVGQHG